MIVVPSIKLSEKRLFDLISYHVTTTIGPLAGRICTSSMRFDNKKNNNLFYFFFLLHILPTTRKCRWQKCHQTTGTTSLAYIYRAHTVAANKFKCIFFSSVCRHTLCAFGVHGASGSLCPTPSAHAHTHTLTK